MTEESAVPKPKLKLSDVGGDSGLDVYELRSELRTRISTERIVKARSHDALLLLARDEFEFSGAVDTFCDALLQQLDLKPKITPGAAVVRGVLGFLRLPHEEHEALLRDGLNDLKKIEDLLTYYETLPAVAAEQKGKTPRNHEDHTVVEFYRRCLDERGRIARYLTSGAALEALEKADEGRNFLGGLGVLRFQMPPYPLRSLRGIERYDVRQINCWRHRVRPLPLSVGRELGSKYDSDRAGFYTDLSTHIPVSKVFEQIFDVLPRVAKLKKRTAVFEEMKTLYEHEHWYGLYALALPHVEGLFTEMLELAARADQTVSGALPDKVGLIRQYAAAHEQNLDYFEFVVPNERNRFMHTGRVEDPKLRAIETLYDLAYVARLYIELETPVIELLNLIDGHELPRAESFAPWAHLFSLLQKVDKLKQRDQVTSHLDKFWASLVPNDDAKRSEIAALCKALDERVALLQERIRTITREAVGIEVDVCAKRTAETFEKRQQVRDAISEATMTADDFFDVLDIAAILKGMVAESALPADAETTANAALTRHKTSLENIAFVAADRDAKQ